MIRGTGRYAFVSMAKVRVHLNPSVWFPGVPIDQTFDRTLLRRDHDADLWGPDEQNRLMILKGAAGLRNPDGTLVQPKPVAMYAFGSFLSVESIDG